VNVAVKNSKQFQAVVESAARQLSSVSHLPSGSFVSTPLLYPSGATVVVRIEQTGREFFVSDFGAGHNEAELLGGDLIYRRAAKSISEAAGIDFDQMTFFVLRASEAQLVGAVAAVANCSHEAVLVTSMKLVERRDHDEADILYERLVEVFPASSVHRSATVVGASNTEWHVSSLVDVGRRKVVFEAVNKHPNSVVFAAAKFNDLARLQHPPGRIAVVRRKAEFGTYLGVLSQAAAVIESRAADQTFRDVAASAA
jgi:hypothetical protein